jgi:hypothetical protein
LANSSWPMFHHDAKHTGSVQEKIIPKMGGKFVPYLLLLNN